MSTRAELKSFMDDLQTQFMASPGRYAIEETISARIDTIIRDLWGGRKAPTPFALLAVGGYGRGTVHPHSDIDLLFYFREQIDEETVKVILHPLWDLPFHVGHQIRHSSDFKTFDAEQMESYTAFLDSRFLAGDAEVAVEFQNETLPGLLRRHRDKFLRGLLDMKAQRYVRFGETIFQLEPDLKEAPGGLRDAHWANWLRKALGENGHDSPLSDMLDFHHCVRNFLHFKAGRNFNILSYDFQEEIAEKLGYKPSHNGDAPENLMRDYFLRAGVIARQAASWEESIAGARRLSVPSTFADPLEMLGAFKEAHRTKSKLDAATLATIRKRLASPDVVLYGNVAAAHAVLDMMKERSGIYETLLAMHEVGLLGKIFPEFEEIRCRVIRDFFHKYTVDEHSLIAIRNIEELPPKHRFSAILNELQNPELLLLSLLFHDVGKAHRHDEGNHVHPSTEGVKGILQRMELPEEQVNKVVFVVQAHLEMSKVIMKRDLSDPHVIEQFAEFVGNVEYLRMLTLLTYADVKAVNNEVLTPWKEDLMWQLYVETYNRLTLGLADDQYTQQPALEKDIETIAKALPRGTRPQELRDFLEGFPRHYLKNTPKAQIAEHFRLSRELATKPMVMYLGRNGALYEVLVMTQDRPFLFSKITGVLSYFGMNIVRAQAFSNRRGTICDLITFADPSGYFEKNPSERERFGKVLEDIIAGRRNLNDLLRGKMTSVIYRPQNRGVVPTTIHFDDDFSRRCTILELVAEDAFGLLYRVSNVISIHGCNIEVALITTEGPRALDVFYLTRDGKKLPADLQEQLQRDMSAALAQ
jgi:[protein-PII] uridylyltransferase